MDETIKAAHMSGAHNGSQADQQATCLLCKNYIDGLGVTPADDLGVNIALKIPLVDVFGK